MSNTSNIKSPVIGPIPDWEGLVNQTDATAMAEFISSFPVAKTVTFDEQSRILNEAMVMAVPNVNAVFSVELTGRGLEVSAVSLKGEAERYSCHYGDHILYGHYAVFWSVRGPGPHLARPRPCFLFCDEAAVFLEAA